MLYPVHLVFIFMYVYFLSSRLVPLPLEPHFPVTINVQSQTVELLEILAEYMIRRLRLKLQ